MRGKLNCLLTKKKRRRDEVFRAMYAIIRKIIDNEPVQPIEMCEIADKALPMVIEINRRAPLKKVCSWCQRDGLVPPTEPGELVSHGMCDRHHAEEMARIREMDESSICSGCGGYVDSVGYCHACDDVG